jgi:hypothetical protein
MSQRTQQQSSPQKPGQMTAVMRAVAATGPKVLRIGVVQSGKVSEERIVKDRSTVTIGPSERNTFVFSGGGIRTSHPLFEVVGGEYVLNFLESMTGRVALPTGVSDLEVLKGQARRSSTGAFQVRLTEDSRGKVTVGQTSFLFQFVSPPPVQPRPQLPASVVRGAGAVDWNTTIIAAFAFLAHFMGIGAMYSDWLDPIVDEQASLAGLVDTLDQLPPPPPVEEHKDEEDAKPDNTQAETKPDPKPAAASSKMPDPGSGQKLSQAQAAALSNELEQFSMATLAALGASGPATEGVLKGGDVPTGLLDAAAASSAGVGIGGDLKLGGGGGAIRPGANGGGLGAIGSAGKGSSGETGGVQTVAGPKGNVTAGSSVAAGSVSDASRVVASMTAGFRRCYNKSLETNPDASGSIRMVLRIGPGGEVSSLTATPSGNLPESVVGCVSARARGARFSPPDGGSAVVEVPVSFVKQ